MPLLYPAILRCAAAASSCTRSRASAVNACASSSLIPNNIRLSSTNWNPVNPRGQESNCAQYPTLQKNCVAFDGFNPRTEISPRDGCTSPVIRFISVVLPDPFGPTSVVTPGASVSV